MTTSSAPAGSGATHQTPGYGNASNSDFFQPSLDDYKGLNYPKPPTIDSLVGELERHQLLIIAGDRIDKLPLAAYLALKLQQSLNAAGAALLPVRQWRGLANTKIIESLDSTTDSTIYILPALMPQNIAHKLLALQQTVKQRNHYVIITLENKSAWQASFGQQATLFLHELERSQLYTAQYLTDYFKYRLVYLSSSLHPDILRSSLVHNTIGGYTTQVIAGYLESPSNIDDFVTLLTKIKHGKPSKSELDKLIIDAKANEGQLRNLFSNLPQRKQLLVIALHLFPGLLDDQFFNATDRLVEQAWERREPSLRAVDYGDLSEFEGRWFNYVDQGEGKVIELSLPNQRSSLFKYIWPTHCRHVLSAMEVMIGLTLDSVDASPEDWQLFGSNARRERVRVMLYETISDIGLQGVRDVEETLLRLAVHPHINVQVIAAAAIARWEAPAYRQSSRMEQLLRRWRDQQIRRSVETFWPHLQQHPSERPETYLLITMAMALGRASTVHQPNQLPAYLYELFGELVGQKNRAVRQVLVYETLSWMLPVHLTQPEVERNVKLLAQDAELHEAVAEVLAQAYRANPQEVAETLDHWYEACLAQDSKQLAPAAAAERVCLLACVCACYGLINYTAQGQLGTLDPDSVAQKVRAVLERDQTHQVRKAALTSLINLRRQKPIELRNALRTMTTVEMDQIVAELTETYMAQRREQRNGERTLLMAEKRYDIWPTRPHDRPPTTIEQELMGWLEDARDPRAQQIAMRALVSFRSRLDDKLTYEEQNPTAAPAIAKPATQERPRALVGLYPQNFYMHSFVPGMATGWSQFRLMVRGVISELVSQAQRQPRQTERLLADLANMSTTNAQQTQHGQTGHYLRQGLVWAKRREWIENLVLILLVLLALGLIIALFTPPNRF